MNFTNKIDDDLCKNLIENQDLLLSSNINEGDIGIDLLSMMQDSEDNLINLQDLDQINSQQDQPIVQEEQICSNDQLGYNDEIIDSNLFEFLRSEDPDVASLLDSLNNSDFNANYLPQISVNTTNKVLDDVVLENEPQVPKKEIYNIVTLNNDDMKREVVTPPVAESLPEANIIPSRVSLRLIKRKSGRGNKSDQIITTKPKKEPKRLVSNLTKRNRSIHEDIDESGSLCSNDSNEIAYKSIDTSVGYESDEHIYFDDDDFASNNNENSNERDFQKFVLNYKNPKNSIEDIKLEPGKKDANKEAATRYRLKKLSEKDQMFETRMILEKENDDVKRRCEIVHTEINYLKNLLVQMLLTKGIIGDQLSK